jgi:DNA-binding NarL/FixJ family response regulator
MDVRMPVLDGIATRELCADRASTARVLVLTTFDLDEFVLAALRAGASGFLLKDTPREALYAAVRTVAAGEALPPQRHAPAHRAAPAPRDPPAELTARLDRLTGREREVLMHIARGLSNADIAAKMYLGEATVRTHVGHVFAKIGGRDRAQAVAFAYESGHIHPGQLNGA